MFEPWRACLRATSARAWTCADAAQTSATVDNWEPTKKMCTQCTVHVFRVATSPRLPSHSPVIEDCDQHMAKSPIHCDGSKLGNHEKLTIFI